MSKRKRLRKERVKDLCQWEMFSGDMQDNRVTKGPEQKEGALNGEMKRWGIT